MAGSEIIKRKYPRRAFNKSVGILFQGEYFICTAGTIGEGGMLLYLPKPLEIDQQMLLSFQIPGGDFISLRGDVRGAQGESTEFGIPFGIRFINMTFNHKRMIRNFVSDRTESEVEIQ